MKICFLNPLLNKVNNLTCNFLEMFEMVSKINNLKIIIVEQRFLSKRINQVLEERNRKNLK